MAQLERDRDEFAGTLSPYSGRALPSGVQAYIASAAAELEAAREHERQQTADLARLPGIYDAQLKRLQSRPDWR